MLVIIWLHNNMTNIINIDKLCSNDIKSNVWRSHFVPKFLPNRVEILQCCKRLSPQRNIDNLVCTWYVEFNWHKLKLILDFEKNYTLNFQLKMILQFATIYDAPKTRVATSMLMNHNMFQVNLLGMKNYEKNIGLTHIFVYSVQFVIVWTIVHDSNQLIFTWYPKRSLVHQILRIMEIKQLFG